MSAPRPPWPPQRTTPLWVPALLVATAVISAFLGFAVAVAPAACRAGVWL